MLPAARPEPAPPAPEPLVIEPPPWAQGDVALAPLATPDPGPPLDALSALKVDEPFEPPPLDLEPPEVYAPLVPVAIPAPNWRAEQAERDRVRAAEAQEKLEPTRSIYPAKPAPQKATRWP